MNEKFRILIQISLKFVLKSPIDNKSALVQVMAWHRTGYWLLLEPMLTHFPDAYMRHSGESLNKVNSECVTHQNLYKGIMQLVAHNRCGILFVNDKIQDGSQRFLVVLSKIFSYDNIYQQEIKLEPKHNVESPSMVDPQWNILYWGSKWNLHTVCWDAVGFEWGTTSVYFGITYVCFIPCTLPLFAVEPQYLLHDFLFFKSIIWRTHKKIFKKINVGLKFEWGL